eukprot:CAMPEP_0179171324 /NCGR_PEP_ID=MMETSP0796-20121207/84448_1 /TAXON_ID=73915 /ORGANISM="Pyrodinium bahamense, Strain pbaha01" /LENGTH=47 /DNA_ID= /DNA_START= /DNA_END= /DNA_ORIENTATION=
MTLRPQWEHDVRPAPATNDTRPLPNLLWCEALHGTDWQPWPLVPPAY